MNERFIQLVDQESSVVDAIIDKAMFHTRKEESRRFLRFIDNYICYYLNRESRELCFPIIRIPSSPSWAREVLLKYLILRLSIYYNQDSLYKLMSKQAIHLLYIDPDDSKKAREARKLNKYQSKWNRYKKTIKALNEGHNYIGENGHKNLIFCTPNDLMVSRVDKNEFIGEFYGEPDDILSDKNICICHNLKSKDIRHIIKKSTTEVKIDNICFFYKQ